jgi:DNA topoisomerase-1
MLTWHGDCSRQAVGSANGRNYSARAAKAAGLRFVADTLPGIRRRKTGTGFSYARPQGGPVADRDTLDRIRALAIPPAWREVWICPHDDGHLQATGRDARGRKQYRYHRRWRELRDETKFGRMAAFGKALPRIRRRVARHLALSGLPREKVLATVVRLLETTLIRVGNQEYARDNESFGLTTLRERQVRVRGARLQFRFRGKSGVLHDIELADARLARIVRRMQDLPGEELVQYVDDSGETRRVESADVNGYLKALTGQDFTSKDFRTWAGTLLAARALCRMDRRAAAGQAQRNVAQAIEAVARQLGNTRAVCRKCYVHPAIVDGYLEGRLPQAVDEKALVAFLRPARSRPAPRSLVPLLSRSLAARRLRGDPATSRGASP